MALDPYLERYRELGGGCAFAVVDSTGSTNRLAAAVARSLAEDDGPPPPLILVAREQTAGRGRLQRRWLSPAGQGIYTSLLLPISDDEALAALPMRVPVALCEALDPVLGVRCRIKWPNDLVVAGGKLGGVLIEALAGPRAVVVGYGLNVLQTDSRLPLPGATSIRVVTGSAPDLPRLTVELALALVARLGESCGPDAAAAAYAERSIHRPGDELRCRIGEEELGGRFGGFDRHGRLRLETADGERLLSTADALEKIPAAPPDAAVQDP